MITDRNLLQTTVGRHALALSISLKGITTMWAMRLEGAPQWGTQVIELVPRMLLIAALHGAR